MASIAPTLRDAIEETTRVVLSLLADELQRSCVLVGGAALLRHDLCRKTEDVDFAVTLAAQFAVVEGARAHPRFSVDEMQALRYHTSDDLSIQIDLITVGDEAIPEVRESVLLGGVWVASLGDLWLCKGRAVVNREKDTDKADFEAITKALGASLSLEMLLDLVRLVK